VRDEYREEYDEGRGGLGRAIQAERLRRGGVGRGRYSKVTRKVFGCMHAWVHLAMVYREIRIHLSVKV